MKVTKMTPRIDMTGQVFGRLTVIELSRIANNGHQFWLCECECGNVKEVSRQKLIEGTTASCGCNKAQNTKVRETSKERVDLLGKSIGRLHIIKELGTNVYLCQCSCGRKVSKTRKQLLNARNSGCAISCGCLMKDIYKRFLCSIHAQIRR